jgi:hypothetical protein
MQNKSQEGYTKNLNEPGLATKPDSNLRDTPSKIISEKPDTYYLKEINKITCNNPDKLVQDNTNNTYEEDNYFCYNNGTNGSAKKLVQWKKVDGLWIQRHLTNSSEYKEINNNVCKVVTPGCDSYNPSQGCVVKCFLDNKTTNVFTANYEVLPN